MKIRQGFVSNSSSSSFIIHPHYICWDVDKEEVLKSTLRLLRNYRKRHTEKLTYEQFKKFYGYTDDNEKVRESYERHKEFIADFYSDENLNVQVHVDDIDDVKDKLNLDFWYAGRLLQYGGYVIWDEWDNYIPEEVARKIIKKYDLDVTSYELHMG